MVRYAVLLPLALGLGCAPASAASAPVDLEAVLGDLATQCGAGDLLDAFAKEFWLRWREVESVEAMQIEIVPGRRLAAGALRVDTVAHDDDTEWVAHITVPGRYRNWRVREIELTIFAGNHHWSRHRIRFDAPYAAVDKALSARLQANARAEIAASPDVDLRIDVRVESAGGKAVFHCASSD